jgi:hypothetical protein
MRTDAWQVERDWVPADGPDLAPAIVQAARLRRAIVQADYPPALAAGIVAWLLERSHDESDHTSPSVRSRYRRVLESLPDGPRRPGERPIMYLM